MPSITCTLLSPRSASNATEALKLSEKFRRFVILASIHSRWIQFSTLIRFDVVYVGHFKCNIRRIADYPNLSEYLRDLYQQPGIAKTVNLEHIKKHYYESHETINPSSVVPKGPVVDFTAPHNRK